MADNIIESRDQQNIDTINSADEMLQEQPDGNQTTTDPAPDPLLARMLELDEESQKIDSPAIPSLQEPDVLKPKNSEAIVTHRMRQMGQAGVLSPEAIMDRANDVDQARGIYKLEDSKRREITRTLAKETGEDPLNIDALLQGYTPDEIRTKYKIPTIARDFPILSQWSSNPENYVLRENTGDWTTGLSANAQAASVQNKAGVAASVQSGLYEYPKAAVYSMLALGALDTKTAQAAINAMEKSQKDLRGSIPMEDKAEMATLEKAWKGVGPGIRKIVQGLAGAYENATDDELDTLVLPELMKIYDGTEETLGEALAYMKAMYENPTGAAHTVAQVLTSSIGPIAVGTGVSLAATPVAGAISAGAVGLMQGVGESLQSDMEEFRDPVTGEVDIEKAWSDPDRAARYRKRAAAYGGVMAVSSSVYQLYLGKGFSKIIKTGVSGGVKAGAKEIAKEVVVGGLEEGLSQASATIAQDAVVGELTEETFVRAGTEGLQEAGFGALLGGGIGGVKVGVGLSYSKAQQYFKTKKSTQKADDANQSMVDTHKLKNIVNQDRESADNHTSQVKSLIDQNVTPPPLSTLPGEEIKITPDAKVEIEVTEEDVRMAEAHANNGTVQVTPSEILEYFEKAGLNPEEQMRTLPPAIYTQYVNNKESDVAVDMNLSDWVMAFGELTDIEEIIRVNGNEMNAQEAGETVEVLQANPFPVFESSIDPTTLPPALPGEQAVVDESVLDEIPKKEKVLPEVKVEPDTSKRVNIGEGEVIQMDDIKARFRSEDDTKAYNTVLSRLRKGMKGLTGSSPEATEAFAKIQFQRMKNRAEILGLSTLELAKDQTIVQGESDRVGGSFRPSENRLFFSQHATPTVVMHEFAHSWLFEMSTDYHYMSNIDFDKMSPAQKDYWHSMELAADMLSIDNVGVLDTGDYLDAPKSATGINHGEREAHEMFAETAEKYLLEGKFANSKVRALMEKFRTWAVKLVGLIKFVSGREQQITPEVERMFEGIIGVDRKINEELIPIFPEPLVPLDNVRADTQKNYNITQEALKEAVGTFAARIMGASYRERENLISGAIQQAEAQAEAIVALRPEMIVGAQMEDNYTEYKKAKKEGKTVSDPRISYKSFEGLFNSPESAKAAKGMMPSFAVAPSKRGGVDVAVLMYQLGINDKAEMVKMLTDTGMRDAMVIEEANAIIDENFPILKSDIEIKDEAVKALGNSKVERYFNMQMKILARDYLPTLKNLMETFATPPQHMMKKEYISNKANNNVMDMSAHKFSPKKFRAMYAASGRKAAKAFKGGDFAKAFNQYVLSAIAFTAEHLAFDVQLDLIRVDKIVSSVKTIAKDPAKMKRQFNAELVGFALQVTKAMESGAEKLPMLVFEDFDPSAGVTPNVVESINRSIAELESEAKGVNSDAMTVRAKLIYGGAIQVVLRASQAVKKVEILNKQYELDVVKEGIIKELDKSKSAIVNFRDKKFASGVINVQTALSSMFPDEVAWVSSWVNKLFEGITEQESLRTIKTKEDLDIVTNAFKLIAKVSKKSNLERTLGPLVSRSPYVKSLWEMDNANAPIVSGKDEINYTFDNMAQYLIAELLMGSESGAEKFLKGGQKVAGQLNAVPLAGEIDGKIDRTGFNKLRSRLIAEGKLTKVHFDALQTIWDMLRDKHAPMKSIWRQTDGSIIGKIEGIDVVTEFGTYKGGYFPLGMDKELKELLNMNKLMDQDYADIGIPSLAPVQNTSAAKSRKDQFYPVNLEPSQIMLYVGAVNNLIYMRKPMQDLNKILMDQGVRKALERVRPGLISSMLIPWQNRVLNQQRTAKGNDTFDKVIPHIRAGVNLKLYLGNIGTPIKQFVGLVSSLPDVGLVNLTKAISRFMISPKATRARVKELSIGMENRFQEGMKRYVTDFEDIQTNFDWVTGMQNLTSAGAYLGIQAAQQTVDTAIFMAALDRAKARGLNEKLAAKYAFEIVQKTQSSPAISWLTSTQTSAHMSKLVQGIATSYMLSMYGITKRATMREANAWAKIAALAGAGTVAWLLPSILDQIVSESIRQADPTREDEDEDETFDERLATLSLRAIANTLGGTIPYVGNMVTSYFYGGRVDVAPMLTLVGKTATAGVKGGISMSRGVTLTNTEIKGMLDVLTITTLGPMSLLGRDAVANTILQGLSGKDKSDRLEQREDDLYELKD